MSTPLWRRVGILARRALRAAAYGVFFRGTTGFELPPVLSVRGQKVRLNPGPGRIGAGWDFINLWLDDEYGLRSLPQAPQTILDVGANVGLFSLLAARLFPQATIHAYEPNPAVAEACQQNLEQAGVVLYRQAVSLERGWVEMQGADDYRGAQAVKTTAGQGIECAAFREAVQRLGGHVDLLKLDCEGAEWSILQDEATMTHIDVVRMEYHLRGRQSAADVDAVAARLGFRCKHVRPNAGFGVVWWDR